MTFHSSGCVRLFGFRKDGPTIITQTAEIAAHTRPITAFDLSENYKYLLTASEDGFVKIWLLYEDGCFRTMKHFCSVPMKDTVLMGARFVTTNGNKFYATAYDSNIVSCFSNFSE